MIHTEESYSPFMFIADRKMLDSYNKTSEIIPLKGDGFLRFLVRVPTPGDLEKLQRHLKRVSGLNPSDPKAPYYYQKDIQHLYLLETGRTLFKGMTIDDVVTMALDIETFCEETYEFSNPERPEDRIISIALADNRGREEVISGHKLDEPSMLKRLTEIITGWDPDIIFGHNIFKFDMSYIVRRARMHGVRLPWGRDGREPAVHNSRLTVAERVFDYPKWEINGRHVIDTYILTLFFDVSTRELESFGLKDVARALNVAGEDRTYLDMNQVGVYFEKEPGLLSKYNLEDARETLAVGHILGSISFIECQIFPYSFQNTIVRGTATKINSIILREYLHRRAALPSPPGRGKPLAGGATYLFEEGILNNVYHCDIKSLYPSLILTGKIKPRGDHLNVFPTLLDVLTEFRLKAKEMIDSAIDEKAKGYLDALQRAFKILINSFYGLLASRLHNFSDPEAAARVTKGGRTLIKKMMKKLGDLDCRIIEVDTDGIFFQAPGGSFSAAEGERIIREVAADLPSGIHLDMDGIYPAMFSYKVKNYALLDTEGKLVLKGSGIKSRGLEPYLRDYLREAMLLALQGRADEIDSLYDSYRKKIADHKLPVGRLSKKETLVDSIAAYLDKVKCGKRNPAAAYELARASGRDYRPGDHISYYVTGSSPKATVYLDSKRTVDWDPDNPDENVPYYLAKLENLHQKFKPYLTKKPV